MNGVLVYFLCSVADPTLCEEHSLRTPGLFPCMAMAQAELATVVRPGMRIVRWQCSSDGLGETAQPPGEWHADAVLRP